jgi:hypothetical protein
VGKERPADVPRRVDIDGWTEVARKSTKTSSSFRNTHSDLQSSSGSGQNSKVQVHAPTIQPSSSNKFSDLLLDSSSAFFREEDPGHPGASPSGASDGSKLFKLLEATKAPTETALSPHSTARGENELSLNAPSFTPLSQQMRNSPPPPPTAPVAIPVSPREASNLQWIYLDPNGANQGPFTSSQMNSWFEAGYFPKNLPVTWYRTGEIVAHDPIFYPLDRCYPPNLPPFMSPPSVPQPRVVSPPPPQTESRGWLWSAQDDAKLAASKNQNSLSLAEIIKAEEARKKTGKK